MVQKVEKRNGEKADFDITKIERAVFKALTTSEQGDTEEAKRVAELVFDEILSRYSRDEVPHVEDIQDIVEEILISEGLEKAAKEYILYREKRREIREVEASFEDSMGLIGDYIDELDWKVKENANMTYSLQGLNQYVTSHVTEEYWLNKIYPERIRKAAKEEDFHIHDLNLLGTYCCGWDLRDLLTRGFGGVKSKIESKPPKHLRPAFGQIFNFFYTLQGESAGAQAMSNFDTFLAPFIAYDDLNYKQVKQAMQEFFFNCMVPTRVGFQTPFINVSLDIKVPEHLKDEPVIIGGEPQKATYGEFQEEMNMFNRAFYEVLMEGDAKGRVFTFPIPTISITEDFDWDNETLGPMWEATAKYGVNYFSNYVNSDMNPEDARSMCCRLRLDNRELINRGGGLFGSNPLTGSIGVVTINMPRIGYLSDTKEEYYNRLENLMDLAKESLEIKRKVVNDFMEKGLYPYSKHYLSQVKELRGTHYGNHFSTIGLMGMHESCLNFLGEGIDSEDGKEFSENVLDFMNEKLVEYQKETGNLYNLEATPGESTSHKQALKDKEKYPDIITAGTEETPYYTNSVHPPVDYTDDPFELLDHQDSLQAKFTGGTVIHLFLGEKVSSPEAAKRLVRKVTDNYELPYVSLTPTFSVCPNCGYLHGEKFRCPKCKVQEPQKVVKNINNNN